MIRHDETATRVPVAMGESGIDPARAEGLREIAFGDWEGAKNEEMQPEIAGILGYEHQSAAGGGDVLVISSGLTIVMTLIDLDADPAELGGGIQNGSVSELHHADGAWTIVSMNDGSYAGH